MYQLDTLQPMLVFPTAESGARILDFPPLFLSMCNPNFGLSASICNLFRSAMSFSRCAHAAVSALGELLARCANFRLNAAAIIAAGSAGAVESDCSSEFGARSPAFLSLMEPIPDKMSIMLGPRVVATFCPFRFFFTKSAIDSFFFSSIKPGGGNGGGGGGPPNALARPPSSNAGFRPACWHFISTAPLGTPCFIIFKKGWYSGPSELPLGNGGGAADPPPPPPPPPPAIIGTKLSCFVTTAAIISRSFVSSFDNISNFSSDADEAAAGSATAAPPTDGVSAPAPPAPGFNADSLPHSVYTFAVLAHGTKTCVLFSSLAKSASEGTRQSLLAFPSPVRMLTAAEESGSATRTTLMFVRGSSQPTVRDTPPRTLMFAISCAVWRGRPGWKYDRVRCAVYGGSVCGKVCGKVRVSCSVRWIGVR